MRVMAKLMGAIAALWGVVPCAAALTVQADTVQRLEVDNGAFDTSLLDWSPRQFFPPVPGTLITWSPLDAGLSPGSGSAAVLSETGFPGPMTVHSHSCFRLRHDFALRVRLKHRMAVGGGDLLVQLLAGFAGDTPESDPPCVGPGWPIELRETLDASEGFTEYVSEWLQVNAPLAQLSIGFTTRAAAPFALHLDDVIVEIAQVSTLFENGME
jgi:hypothetical protein